MKPRSQSFNPLPLDIVGSTVFGRYAKISVEQTINMIISDGWLVDYAGYNFAIRTNGVPQPINQDGVGRGIYKSTRLNELIICVFDSVYAVFSNLSFTKIGTLATFSGDVFIAEDNQNNIAICDKLDIWIYNSIAGTFLKATKNGTDPLDFLPGYIYFHNSRFLSVDLNNSTWRLSDPLNGNNRFPFDAQHVGAFQTKADKPIAIYQVPGRSNMIFVMGSIVTQAWTDTGAALFPYQLNTGVNIDYGVLNSDTVDNLDNIVCWLGANERSGPVILTSNGGVPQRISNDGIDFKLASLTTPSDSHGFMFKQDGHIFYQLTFPTDNFSLTYDFNTKGFFIVTDQYLNYHPGKRVAFFNNTYYFVNVSNGFLYQMSTNETTYVGHMVPRVRVCRTIRTPDGQPFVTNNLAFPIEQGVDVTGYDPAYYQLQQIVTQDDRPITTEDGRILLTERGAPPRSTFGNDFQAANPPPPNVDLYISMDGGQTFGNGDRMALNSLGNRKNRFIYYNLGWGNEFTPLFRFNSLGRFVCGNGEVSIYQ